MNLLAMHKNPNRDWLVVEEVEFELLDGNSVRVEWRTAEPKRYAESKSDEIRIHTTARLDASGISLFRTLRADRDFHSGWQPIIISSIVEATRGDIRNSPFSTVREFLVQLRYCFDSLWSVPFDVPTLYGRITGTSFLIPLHDEAVAFLSEWPYGILSDSDLESILGEWGED
jgi:hypothetical protein